MVFAQPYWHFFDIPRVMRGFVVAVVGSIVTVSKREAASQQLHKIWAHKLIGQTLPCGPYNLVFGCLMWRAAGLELEGGQGRVA